MEFTVAAIAAFLGGTVEGNSEAVINDISPIESGKPGAISFLANPKYEDYIYKTEATAVIVANDFQPRESISAALVRVADPYTAFSALLEQAQSMQSSNKSGVEAHSFIAESATVAEDVYVGAFAYIGENAVVGKGSKIYPNAFIGDEAIVGENSVIHPNVSILRGCKVGNNCIVHAGSVIGSDGFGFAPQEDGTYKKVPQTGIVVLEDNVEVGANVTIDRATIGETVLKSGCKIDNLVQIAHNVKVGSYTVIAAQSGISGSTILGDNCMIGGQVGIVGHIELADGTKVGAQSGVSKTSKEENAVLRGSPAQDIKKQLKSEALFRQLDRMSQKIRELEQKLANFED